MDDMCQPRDEIIKNDPQIQKAIKELESLYAKEGNGHTRREIFEYELLIETRIEGVQTQQDVGSIKGSVEKILGMLQVRKKYPSVIYQLMRLPGMGWTLLGASVLLIWLIGQLGPDLVIKWLGAADITATAGDVHAVVGFIAAGLVVAAGRRYVKHIEDCEEKEKL